MNTNYTANSLNTLFETIPEIYIVEFLQEAGFFYLIWMVRHSEHSPTRIIPGLVQYLKLYQPQTWTMYVGLITLLRDWKPLWEISTCVGRLICPEGHVSTLNKCNPIQDIQTCLPIDMLWGMSVRIGGRFIFRKRQFIIICHLYRDWYTDTKY